MSEVNDEHTTRLHDFAIKNLDKAQVSFIGWQHFAYVVTHHSWKD